MTRRILLGLSAVLLLSLLAALAAPTALADNHICLDLRDLRATCSGGSITGDRAVDTPDGCRYVTCGSSGGERLQVKACEKPAGDGTANYELYKVRETGDGLRLCIGDACLRSDSERGFSRSGVYSLCDVDDSADDWSEDGPIFGDSDGFDDEDRFDDIDWEAESWGRGRRAGNFSGIVCSFNGARIPCESLANACLMLSRYSGANLSRADFDVNRTDDDDFDDDLDDDLEGELDRLLRNHDYDDLRDSPALESLSDRELRDLADDLADDRTSAAREQRLRDAFDRAADLDDGTDPSDDEVEELMRGYAYDDLREADGLSSLTDAELRDLAGRLEDDRTDTLREDRLRDALELSEQRGIDEDFFEDELADLARDYTYDDLRDSRALGPMRDAELRDLADELGELNPASVREDRIRDALETAAGREGISFGDAGWQTEWADWVRGR